jgi:hypothetical protein
VKMCAFVMRLGAWCLVRRAGFVVDTMWFLKSDSERGALLVL